MQVQVDSRFLVESEPDIFRAVQWAGQTGHTIRPIQTVVGAYGAIDQNGGTVYFDVGDMLAVVLDQVVVIPSDQVTDEMKLPEAK